SDLADAIQGNPSVTGFWLKRNPIGLEGANAVAKLLRNNQTLQTLDLVHTEIGSEGLMVLVKALMETNRSVTRLYLGGNRLGPKDASVLAMLLRENDAIRHLYLSVNRLADEGTEQLCEGLKDNRTLETVSLSSNHIGPRGAQVLAETLAHHPALQALDLAYDRSTRVLAEEANHIGDVGAAAFAGLLRQNLTLQSLDLSSNGISDSGARLLCEALEDHPRLTELRLGRGISKRWKQDIQKHLDRNRLQNPQHPTPAELLAIQSVYR
ncbi:MAG: hypothetical protein KDA84_09775, partial [Planctomycetaceae bacterium]|nr:hypothetical protein [Planctomycetaceae bacterium]